MAKKDTRIKTIEPWTFIPANAETRANFQVGMGKYYGKALKNRMGRIRHFSNISPPKDKTAGFEKPITQA